MRKTVVIPTYWCRNSNEEWQEGDGVFDHPTPLDKEGTLRRTLESVKILEDKDFKLVILVCPTTDSIEDEVTEKVAGIIKDSDLDVETYIFTPRDLNMTLDVLKVEGVYAKAYPLLDLKHYSPVRNVCLLVGIILASEAVILIDDDEVFEIPDFISRSVEFLLRRVYGDLVYGVAGYYLNKNDRYYDDVEDEAWMTYWDRFGAKAKAFDKVIGSEPRVKRTPFAFGGLMIMHKELFHTVPFDPNVTRGEDIDYLINSRMYGFSFFLDNTLSIKHLPEPKSHPRWKRMREDIYRFVYEKEKIASQYETGNMVMITPEEFEPYPGDFLGDDLEDKIYRSNMMSALDYLAEGDADGAREALENIRLAKKDAVPSFHPFTAYREAQKNWVKVVKAVKDNRNELRRMMEANNLTKRVHTSNSLGHILTDDRNEISKIIREQEIFNGMSDGDVMKLAEISQVKEYYENERIFNAGEHSGKVAFITKGKVSLNMPGDETEVSELVAGTLIGESDLMYGSYRTNCTARENTELLVIEADRLRKLVEEDPEFGTIILMMVIRGMSHKIYDTNMKISDIMNFGNRDIGEEQ